MKRLACLSLFLFACSNAANPTADAPPQPQGSDASGSGSGSDAPPAALRILVLNEVVASGSPDWFEVVNATAAPVEMSDFVFVDEHDNFTKAVPFAQKTLAPGEYFAQDVDGTTVPFKLGSDEELWIYRASDHALDDGVDWAEGDSPAAGSFARNPDVFGNFVSSTTPTKGAPNQF